MIKLYGAPWCGDCIRSKAFLANNNIEYEYIDIDSNEEAGKHVEEVNKGNRSIPLIEFDDGTFLVEPSDFELGAKIGISV